MFAVIFDMDGVLVDSPKYVWLSYNRFMAPYGVRFSGKDIKKYLGRSLRDQARLWEKDYGIRIDKKDLEKKSWEIQWSLMKNNISASKPLLALLSELRRNKVPMGVGTSSKRFRAEAILRRLKIMKYFSAVVTSDDIRTHKPSPDLFLTVARGLGAPPERCVVIEDAASGIEAARRAGMKSIGFVTRYQTKKDMKGADMVVKGFSGLSFRKISGLFTP